MEAQTSPEAIVESDPEIEESTKRPRVENKTTPVNYRAGLKSMYSRAKMARRLM